MTENESTSETPATGETPVIKRSTRRRTVKRDDAESTAEQAAPKRRRAASSGETQESSRAATRGGDAPDDAEVPTASSKPSRSSRAKRVVSDADAEVVSAPASSSTDEENASHTKRTVRKKRVSVDESTGVGEVSSSDKAATSATSVTSDQAVSDNSLSDESTASDKLTAPDKPASDEALAQAEGETNVRRPRRSVRTGGSRDASSQRSGGQGQQRQSSQGTSGGQSSRGAKQNTQNQRRGKRDRTNRGREIVPSVTLEELAAMKVAELRAKAAELELDVTGLKKAELIQAVYEANMKAEGFIEVSGVLDIMADGYGFLRTQGYLPSETDCYVGLSLIRRNGLRKGDLITGQTRPARENEKYAAIQKIATVNGRPLEECGNRVRFADLTPVYPDERLWMEHGKNTITARVIDLAAPIGKGQRGLIVSPPKAGKTTILKDIAASITANNPEVHLMCLLVDERPEEVTDMQRSVHGEVISSTFDMPSENHIAVAELVIERAKRMVEEGHDVVILLDSLTRLARAYNLAQPASGRILSGGVDSTALYPPKRFLGAARNIEHGGSLTILASALIETGSKMDEVIFEEFKGTGNMELKLDRSLADRRIFPAIDPVSSGTRKEDLLLDPQEAPLIWAVRRILANLSSTERAMDMLIKSLKQTETNQEFLIRTAKKAQHSKGEGIVEF
ncbi:transcription termination factor Rho [Adlercreutzia sp. ZJ138]|uniref:transcription termination factor Rho n=1 Tax=Adlercreutzia sp. ZJ138 TaxID=2709405 RepID=UPI001F1565BF|nr:transcription termination factor Rho [Adlercreutzia sp. ZJ138]